MERECGPKTKVKKAVDIGAIAFKVLNETMTRFIEIVVSILLGLSETESSTLWVQYGCRLHFKIIHLLR